MRLFDSDASVADALLPPHSQSLAASSFIGELLHNPDKAHPRGLTCAGPGCDRTHSVTWTKPADPNNLPWAPDPSSPLSSDDIYLCWQCCALYALQGADADAHCWVFTGKEMVCTWGSS
ncbi:hypothetical protein PTSG_10978 [Salpingoeca rosetta]|uniref:Uncharacterized protein n=1 Tax=Salpingoeca rosetta (strain ATCC 50818 / BSB-021) TaxID=946362 RepID=F2USC6_SALR5|nr:uncharacterized protein PTSG_10978 [Salpingoeca rosetta]EGD81035.1 hypothetical protein PTSG_10978 [Salpingoeca rosetta]|eukprot:XP_004987905.1 hypothetical protein PTSG_10978 [Salpingoeca rosetta]